MASSAKEPRPRRDTGTVGTQIRLRSNQYNVRVEDVDGRFFLYTVAITYKDEDDHPCPLNGEGERRKLLDQMRDRFNTDHPHLKAVHFAYDGYESLYTTAWLGFKSAHQDYFEYLWDKSDPYRTTPKCKIFSVLLKYVASVPIQAIGNAFRGQDCGHRQEALRVLDIIVRQHISRRGSLLVGGYHFHSRDFFDIGRRLSGAYGFRSCFRVNQKGMALNLDISTTLTIWPGPVLEYVLYHQNVLDPLAINWLRAKRTLKNLRIVFSLTKQEYRITGLSQLVCSEQRLNHIDVTVFDYFSSKYGNTITISRDLPCLNVGKPDRPLYFPIELCSLVPLTRYTRNTRLSPEQCGSFVAGSRLMPYQRMGRLTDFMRSLNLLDEPMLQSCGVYVSGAVGANARILPTPKLKAGNTEFYSNNGSWNFSNKTVFAASGIRRWAIAKFFSPLSLDTFTQRLKDVSAAKGLVFLEAPFIFEENEQHKVSLNERVKDMLVEIRRAVPQLDFVLCLLPDGKRSELYGPLKNKSLTGVSIVTQCVAMEQFTPRDITHLALKINSKLGGENYKIVNSIPIVSNPTMIIGMHVSEGSIAAVVSSRAWPSMSRYMANVRTCASINGMLDDVLCQPSLKSGEALSEDTGMIRQGLVDFYSSSGSRKPQHIIIFRNGVCDTQFAEVLNREMNQVMKACNLLEEGWCPPITLIVAQKSRMTFCLDRSGNSLSSGTVIDDGVCDPKWHDFFMSPHMAVHGTTRPVRYYILWDDAECCVDQLQEVIHALSYVCQHSTSATSMVAPLHYARLAARAYKSSDFQSEQDVLGRGFSMYF